MEKQTLSWEFPYEIALALKEAHPTQDLETLSLNHLQEMILALPHFQDDASLLNDDLLMSIYQDWYEEILHEQE
jgi:FeS assembly protein IscX